MNIIDINIVYLFNAGSADYMGFHFRREKGTGTLNKRKYGKSHQILFINDEWGKGAPFIPLYDRHAAAGRRLR